MAAPDFECHCFVGGLAGATDNESLSKAFSSYGEVIESKVVNDRETGRSRGFGFVTFATEEAMRAAIEVMNGFNLDGRHITVNEAQSRGGGGGFGRGEGGFRPGGERGCGRHDGGGYGGSRNVGGGGLGGGGFGGVRDHEGGGGAVTREAVTPMAAAGGARE